MIKFPPWVHAQKRQTRLQTAQKRLLYIMVRAALEHGDAANSAAFAGLIGLQRCTVHNYVRNGKFSKAAACAAEKQFGRDLVRAEWLTDPLSIKVA